MTDSLAVLITYHNEGPWLTKCIESALRQPGSPDEVLVYDDASHDPASRYTPDDPRVRVLRGDVNAGPARGRNALLHASTTTFVHYHDADDWFEAGWGERVRAAMADADVVLTDVAIESAEGRKPHVMDVASSQPDLLAYAIRGSVLVPSMTYRRELAIAAGGWNEALHQSEDYEFHIRLLSHRPVVRVLPEDLVIVRAHATNRSRNVTEVWGSAVDALLLLADILPVEYHGDLAFTATRAGRLLYADGAKQRAGEAFEVARKLTPDGTVPFAEPGMRLMGRVLGPLVAERVAEVYRSAFPNSWRAALRGIAKAGARV